MDVVFNKMSSRRSLRHRALALPAMLAAVVLVAGCGSMGMGSELEPAGKVALTGSNEVPSNPTKATGSGMIKVGPDFSVSGSISTTGVIGTAAHIHLAAKGSNGPVIVPLTRTAENTWTVPDGAKLTDTQYASYVAGNLYVNVHSAAMPAGEIRGQIVSN